MDALPSDLLMLVCEYEPASGLALKPKEQVSLVKRLTGRSTMDVREAHLILASHVLNVMALLGPAGIDLERAMYPKDPIGPIQAWINQNEFLNWSGFGEINSYCVDWLESGTSTRCARTSTQILDGRA
jgi:hypothetical protein